MAAPASPLAPLHLAGFCAASFLAVTMMGGVFSCLPPYEAELYGSRCCLGPAQCDHFGLLRRWVGAIHGLFLPFSTVRGLAGPAILLALRQKEEAAGVRDLLTVVDPELFLQTFGAGYRHRKLDLCKSACRVEAAPVLLQGGSLTLSRLAALVPPEIMADPSPFLYDSSMYTMAGLALVAAGLNAAIRPVAAKHFVTVKPD
jgi:hypothetical protein